MKIVKHVIIYLVLIVALAFAAGILFLVFSPDYDVQVVRSESMKPTLRMGDALVTRSAGGEIVRGSIVSFRREGQLITHRVLSVREGNMQTKGDAMEEPDRWVTPISDVEGTFLFRVPYLGYLTAFVRTPAGWAVLVIVPLLLLTGFYVRGIFRRSRPEEAALTADSDAPHEG